MTTTEWKSIARGAAIALGGAALTYVSAVVIPAMQASGNATLLVIAAMASVGINILRKQWEARQHPHPK